MRVFLILMAVLAVVFFAAMGLGGGKDCRSPYSTAPRDAGKKVCETPSWAGAMSVVTDLFAPKIELPRTLFKAAGANAPPVPVPSSKKKSPRIAKFALVDGDAILIIYERPPSCTEDCAVTLCIYKDIRPGNCPKEHSNEKECSIIIADDGGHLRFQMVDPAKPPATVKLQ